jgi:hypothetical protein
VLLQRALVGNPDSTASGEGDALDLDRNTYREVESAVNDSSIWNKMLENLPLGNSFTATQDRDGLCVKYFSYTPFISAKFSIVVRKAVTYAAHN